MLTTTLLEYHSTIRFDIQSFETEYKCDLVYNIVYLNVLKKPGVVQPGWTLTQFLIRLNGGETVTYESIGPLVRSGYSRLTIYI